MGVRERHLRALGGGQDEPATTAPRWLPHTVVGARWSEVEDARLQREFAAGLTTAQIASKLERTPRAVHARIGLLRRRGADLPRRREAVRDEDRWSDVDDKRLVDGYQAGRTLLELAGELERTIAAVSSRVDVLRGRGVDLPPRMPRWTEERRQLLARRRFVEGATLKQLEREFERTRGTITSQLRRLRALGYDEA